MQSLLGQGSTFRFFIQTRTITPPSAIAVMVEASHLARPIPQHSDSANSGSVTPAISLSSNTSMGSMLDDDWTEQHILIVEDNIINQTVLKRQLVKAGLTCDGELLLYAWANGSRKQWSRGAQLDTRSG